MLKALQGERFDAGSCTCAYFEIQTVWRVLKAANNIEAGIEVGTEIFTRVHQQNRFIG